MTRAGAALVLLALCLGPPPARAAGARERPEGTEPSPGGWDHLVHRLTRDGLERGRVLRVFGDHRFPPFTGLHYGLAPRERPSMYRGFLATASIARARRCWSTHYPSLARTEAHYAVPARVVAAILHVESDCGRTTGHHHVLPRLARLAMANEPENVRRNVARHVAGAPRRSRAAIARAAEERARVLEDMFYPEVLAAFRLAERLRIDPLGLRGSSAGAFGIPQFLPSSFERFATDGDGDGHVSLHHPADAIASCANYLVGHGWRAGLPSTEQRRVLRAYNHSDAYVDTVLALASRLPGGGP
jgi:membrane-bound lytic murein transglycosylase B